MNSANRKENFANKKENSLDNEEAKLANRSTKAGRQIGGLSKTKILRLVGALLAALLVCISITGIFSKGLNLGIDFSGGYITEFSTSQAVPFKVMQNQVDSIVSDKFVLNSAEENTYWVLRQEIVEHAASPNSPSTSSFGQRDFSQNSGRNVQQSDATVQQPKENIERLINQMSELSIAIKVLDSDYLDSQLGAELLEQGGLALLTALIIVLIYLALRFEWRFAIAAIVALFHDLIVIVGVFAWFEIEFNLTVLASMLAIIGYSLNDSIVVADRIREKLMFNRGDSISDIVDSAVKSTLMRTLITSGTTLATISAVWLLAGLPLYGFSVALFGGIIVGTLSSISIAATLPAWLGLTGDYYQRKAEEAAMLAKEP